MLRPASLLVLLPLIPHGGNYPLLVILSGLVGVILCIWAWILDSRRSVRCRFSALLPGVAWAWVSVIGLLCLQVLPLGSPLVAFLHEGSSLYELVHPTGGNAYISYDVEKTRMALFWLVSLIFVAFVFYREDVSLWISRNHFGLLTGLIGSQALYVLFDGVRYPFHGSFVNPNSFAAFILILLPHCLFVAARSYSHRDQKALLQAVFLVAAPVSLIALSGSRGGIALMALVLSFFVIRQSFPTLRAGAVSAVLLGIIAVIIFGGSFIELRTDRPELYRSAFSLIKDNYIVGVGLGVFGEAFPYYKSSLLELATYQHAHNEFLELFAEAGVFIGMTLLSICVIAAIQLFRASMLHESGRRAAFVRSAAWTLVVVGVNCLYDFPLHMPLNAAILTLMTVVALRLRLRESGHER